ncbi:hypothetical protein M758_2G082700 [Ceratodon purpureus]|nr:hypothetical protein M758_2G082700 [Ceratodon purpureus]
MPPVADSQVLQFLNQVRNEGGVVYAGLAEKAWRGADEEAAEAAYELAWEELHAGPWQNVPLVWRDAFSLSCLSLASCHYRANRPIEALKVLDLGVIMGGPRFRKEIDSSLHSISFATGTVKGFETSNGVHQGSRPQVALPNVQDVQLRKKIEGRLLHEELNALPAGSLRGILVEQRSCPSLENFLRDYFLPGVPAILTDSINHWPAMKNWSDIVYLQRVAGHRTVPVEVGEHYLATDWKQELMTLSQFLERSLSHSHVQATTRPYLAQHPLFEQIPELKADIVVPDYCSIGGGDLQSINAWLGPAGTITPLHHDPHHNLLTQVVGRKYVRLYTPEDSPRLYPYTEKMLCNSSQVDLTNVDLLKFPNFENLKFVDCILEEGQMLYIPPKWWHYVQSLTPSFSVSFWWSTQSDDDDSDSS